MSLNLATPARTQKRRQASNEEHLVQDALAALEEARIRFHACDNDRRLVLHTEGKARVEFWPLKMRWIEAGNTKRFSGNVERFIEWYKERAGVTR